MKKEEGVYEREREVYRERGRLKEEENEILGISRK